MTEAQAKDFIEDFFKQEAETFARETLYNLSTSQSDMIEKEINAALYRYSTEAADKLWTYIKNRLPKDV